MKNLFKKFIPERHTILADESEVLTILSAIDVTRVHYFNLNLEVFRCLDDIDPKYWAVSFNATYGQWKAIVRRLYEQRFKLYVSDEPKDLYLTRKTA